MDPVQPNIGRTMERDAKSAFIKRLTVWIPFILFRRGWLLPPQKLSSAAHQILISIWNGQVSEFGLDPATITQLVATRTQFTQAFREAVDWDTLDTALMRHLPHIMVAIENALRLNTEGPSLVSGMPGIPWRVVRWTRLLPTNPEHPAPYPQASALTPFPTGELNRDHEIFRYQPRSHLR